MVNYIQLGMVLQVQWHHHVLNYLMPISNYDIVKMQCDSSPKEYMQCLHTCEKSLKSRMWKNGAAKEFR